MALGAHDRRLAEAGFPSSRGSFAAAPFNLVGDFLRGHKGVMLDHVDMRRAKEVAGGKACVAGNVPPAKLTVGTPDDVRAYCKDLIDAVGRDGGFILGASGQTEDVKIENVKAMVDFAKEYEV